MGPRAFARGDPRKRSTSCRPMRLQWGRELSPAEMSLKRKWLRKENLLQWGRELSPAEIRRHCGDERNLGGASMGPRAFARGDRSGCGQAGRYAVASMGPRAFARGDPPGRCSAYYLRNASMGPRAFARGDLFNWFKGLFVKTMLQWGRELSPAEITPYPFMGKCHLGASMGPRAFARGDLGDRVAMFASVLASMGPRAFARGDLQRTQRMQDDTRSFNGAASFRPRRWEDDTHPGWIYPRSLQWGRELSPAEIDPVKRKRGE